MLIILREGKRHTNGPITAKGLWILVVRKRASYQGTMPQTQSQLTHYWGDGNWATRRDAYHYPQPDPRARYVEDRRTSPRYPPGAERDRTSLHSSRSNRTVSSLSRLRVGETNVRQVWSKIEQLRQRNEDLPHSCLRSTLRQRREMYRRRRRTISFRTDPLRIVRTAWGSYTKVLIL